MSLLKRLFGGGSRRSTGGYRSADDRYALYLYVRPKRCDEVVQVRVNLMNDLSAADQGDGYFTRKMVSATRCPFQAELSLHFDRNKKLVSSDITNGEIVDEDAFIAAQNRGTS